MHRAEDYMSILCCRLGSRTSRYSTFFQFERDAMTQWLSVGLPMHVVDLWPR
jgi:hypothetical protein